ncbi:hypothetical protein PG984_007199 [Apiospora sp. TS-2023a]
MSPRWGDPKPENAYLSNWMAGIDRTAEQCKAIIEKTDAEYEATADRYQKAADQQSQIEEAAANHHRRHMENVDQCLEKRSLQNDGNLQSNDIQTLFQHHLRIHSLSLRRNHVRPLHLGLQRSLNLFDPVFIVSRVLLAVNHAPAAPANPPAAPLVQQLNGEPPYPESLYTNQLTLGKDVFIFFTEAPSYPGEADDLYFKGEIVSLDTPAAFLSLNPGDKHQYIVIRKFFCSPFSLFFLSQDLTADL